jgi:prepilin-type N-terminal cleavage/methylation domain-containing protein
MRVKRSEAGFTLVELLVAVVIIGVITIPLTGTITGALKNSGTTSDRMALSHDAQISSSYFGRDVAGVGLRDYENTGSNTVPFKASVFPGQTYTCGATVVPNAVVVLMSDAWDPAQSMTDPQTVAVAYYVKSGDDELRRAKCSAGVSVSDIPVVHNVKTAVATCSSTCTSATVPDEITLRIVVTKPSVGDYPITLNGQRRQS